MTPQSNVFNMDCMIGLKAAPGKFWDLAVVDVPYGIGEDGQSNHSRGSAAGANKFKGTRNTTGKGIPSTKYEPRDWDNAAPDKEYFDELFRVSKNQIIWGANHFISRMPKDSSCWIVWDKNNGMTDFADCELAWTSFDSAVRKFTFTWNGMLQGNMANREKRIHPCQKPQALYHWLFSKYAKKGFRVLDTHMGSQNSRIAAYKLGLDYTGYEIDQMYFDDGCRNFEQSISEPLFDQPKTEQGKLL